MIETEQHPMIDGRYRIIESLGSGESMEVYRAHDSLLEREVALKVLKEEHDADQDRIEGFCRAARSAASLSHPNIVQVYELGRADSGLPFVAAEYFGGGTLADKLRASGAMDPVAAVEVSARICDALRAAHERGVYHCNLNPDKVLLTESGTVKVADFGVTCDSGRDAGAILKDDLYSLGAVLYEMLTGSPPSPKGSEARTPADLDPSIPAEISNLALSLISGSPRERPADARALQIELEEAIPASRSPSSATETSGVYQARIGLLPAFAKRMRSLSPGLPGAGTRPAQSEAARWERRRRRRRRALVLIPLALLLTVSGWAIYEGGLQTAYPGAPQQAEAPAPEDVFVQTANADNISNNSTYLDIPAANGDPKARISITQNWNPDGADGTYNDHPVGVWYDAGREQWAIFNQDRATMPEGASFNVVVWSGDDG